jgi:hypothetical protein
LSQFQQNATVETGFGKSLKRRFSRSCSSGSDEIGGRVNAAPGLAARRCCSLLSPQLFFGLLDLSRYLGPLEVIQERRVDDAVV